MKETIKILRDLGVGDMKYLKPLPLGLILIALFVSASAIAQTQAIYSPYDSSYGTSARSYSQNNLPRLLASPYTVSSSSYSTHSRQANSYNGFSSYEAYLEDYNRRNASTLPTRTAAFTRTPASTSTDPCSFAQTLSIIVTANNNCAPIGRQASPSISPDSYPTYDAYFAAYQALHGGSSSQASSQPRSQVTSSTPSTSAAPYNGYPSYEHYLAAFHAGQVSSSSQTSQQRTAPAQSSGTYNGYPSYEHYLAAFHAGQVSSSSQTSQQRSVPTQSSGTYNGYPSYEHYLAAFRAGQVSSTTTLPNNSVTSGYYGYSSYAEYLRAFNELNGSSPTTTPRTATVPTPTSTAGYFDFVVGQSYSFNDGLVMTVQSLNDSRCPQGVACLWQGNINASVRLAKGAEVRDVTVTITDGQQTPQVVVDGSSVQFVGLGERVNNANTLKTYIVMN